jgi:hypothetical protein
MTIIDEGIRLSKDDIEAGFFSGKDNGKSQVGTVIGCQQKIDGYVWFVVSARFARFAYYEPIKSSLTD